MVYYLLIYCINQRRASKIHKLGFQFKSVIEIDRIPITYLVNVCSIFQNLVKSRFEPITIYQQGFSKTDTFQK